MSYDPVPDLAVLLLAWNREAARAVPRTTPAVAKARRRICEGLGIQRLDTPLADIELKIREAIRDHRAGQLQAFQDAFGPSAKDFIRLDGEGRRAAIRRRFGPPE